MRGPGRTGSSADQSGENHSAVRLSRLRTMPRHPANLPVYPARQAGSAH